MKIESLTNKKVKEWCKLKEKKDRDEKGLFIIEGDHLVMEAKKLGLIEEVISLKEEQGPNSYQVTKDILKKISSQKTPANIMAICKKKKEESYKNRILLLDNIQDPGNLGTIIRSAVAFSYDTLILSEDTVDLYNDKVIRATEGMLFHINVIRRNIKNELSVVEIIISKKLSELATTEIIKVVERMDNRTYEPRVLKELFNYDIIEELA